MAKYNNEVETKTINLISAGTEITGDIVSNGDIRIDGVMIGNMTTKGKVVIGESGKIKGEVNCRNSDVSGQIEGKIVVSELLSLKISAVVTGDIQTSKLAIEPGSKFTGNCNMTNSSPSAYGNKPDPERKTETRPEGHEKTN